MRVAHRLLLLAGIVGLAACGSQKVSPLLGPSGSLTLSANPTSVVADGKSTVAITVSGSSKDVTLTAGKGVWSDSKSASTTVSGGSGAAILVTCDSRMDTSCAGQVIVKATDASGSSGSVAVQYGQLEVCNDGADNNGDGKIDCADPECAGQGCAISKTANGTCDSKGSCVCATGSTEICNDGMDNNCDGLVDCADPTCDGKGCNLGNGLSGTCVMGTCGCAATKEVCNDGIDNDCDGLVDCADPDCQPLGGPGGACSGPGYPNGPKVGGLCDPFGACTCPTGNTEICDNGKDDNCDGLADCLDPNCAAQKCGPNGAVCNASKQCACPGGGKEICDQVGDEDCDGLSDCNDPDCFLQACGPGKECLKTQDGTYVCEDTSTLYSLVLSPTRLSIPADGVSQTVITATLKLDDGSGHLAAVTSAAVSFGSSDASAPLSTTTGTTDSNGQASTTLTSDPNGGTTTVTVSYTDPATSQVVTTTVQITMPHLGTIRFVSAQFPVMGVRSSGYQEINQLEFQLLDSSGLPYPAGLQVNFTHTSVGDSFIGPIKNACGGNTTCATTQTDGNGDVTVLLHSGTAATVVSVSAGAAAGGVSLSASSSTIPIIGALASGLHISLSCSPNNTPALAYSDCTNTSYSPPTNQTITCSVGLADRFNNVLGRGTTVFFNSEAGAPAPEASTPDFDPTKPATEQTGLGYATDYIAVSNHALPIDVMPLPSEYSLQFDDGCGLRAHNPRDGLVTVIASTIGEEGFVDGSNNCPHDGAYNSGPVAGYPSCTGENFIDVGEPYIDANDDGIQDDNEYYVDLNENGVYDGPNGVWDSSTHIWAETRILYSGAVKVSNTATDDWSRWGDVAFPPAPTAQLDFGGPPNNGGTPLLSTASAAALSPPGTVETRGFNLFFTDENFNPPQSPANGASYTIGVVGGNVTAQLTPPANGDGIGMAFAQEYCATANHGGSAAALSAPSGGVVTVTGLSGMKSTDVGNYLTISTSTASANNGVFTIVSVTNPSTVTIANASGVADVGPLAWVDSRSSLTGCSNTCNSAPCYSVHTVGPFVYGATGSATITGAQNPEMGDVVQIAATVGGVTSNMNIYGSCK